MAIEMEITPHAAVIAAYAFIGAFLSAAYYLSPRARQEPLVHLLTAIIMVLGVVVVGFAASIELRTLDLLKIGVPFLLFAGASIFYVPVVIFLILHYWEAILVKITSPGSTSGPPREPRGSGEQWEAIQSYLEVLARDPTDAGAHEKLGDLYVRLGHWDAAVYEYRKAADWLERGYSQGHVLYKAARLLVERKDDIPGAIILLRRIVRLYPRSWFASYARRILSHWEARQDRQDGPARRGPASQS